MTRTGTTTRPKEWKERLAELWYQTKLANDALQIDKDSRRQRSVERLVKKTQDGTLGQATAEPMDDDDDTVSVGNEIHHHHPAPPTPLPPKPSVAKSLAAAGLAAAGLGIGAAAPIAVWNLTKDATEVIEGDDTDTKYGLKIFRDEPNSQPTPRN